MWLNDEAEEEEEEEVERERKELQVGVGTAALMISNILSFFSLNSFVFSVWALRLFSPALLFVSHFSLIHCPRLIV